jgi:hypothetical protein
MGMDAKAIVVEILNAGDNVYLTDEGKAWLDRLTQEETEPREVGESA